MQKCFLFLLVHNSEFLENLIKNYCIKMHFNVLGLCSRAEWVNPRLTTNCDLLSDGCRGSVDVLLGLHHLPSLRQELEHILGMEHFLLLERLHHLLHVSQGEGEREGGAHIG